MIKSNAIIKVKSLSPAKELRLQKKRAKKLETVERRATKVHRPSPIDKEVPNIELNDLTRDEMLQQSDKIGLAVNKHWSNATLLKHINDAMGI